MRPVLRNTLIGLGVAAAAAAGFVALGEGQEPDPQPASTSASEPVRVNEPGEAPGTPSPPAPPGAQPEPGAPDSTFLPIPEASGPPDPIEPAREPYVDDAVSAATQVLVALGDAEGADQPTPSSWLASIDPVITEAGRSSLVGEGEVDLDKPTPLYQRAHEQGWSMVTATECDVNAGAGLSPEALALNCLAVTTTVDASGAAVGPEATGSWPYHGEPTGRVMSMVNDGSGWRFDGFAQAS